MAVPRTIPRAGHPISRGYIDPDALRILYRLQRSGFKAYLVGGSVRDLMTGRTPKDFDIGTDAKPQEIRRLFRNSRIIGRRFRLVHVFFDGGKLVEVSTFRRRPGLTDAEAGEPGEADLLIREDNTFGTPEEDAVRRDFTVNGLFYDIGTFAVLDYVGGVDDLEARTIRTIGDPEIRFREDPVRMLRACEFAARLDFRMEPGVVEAIDELRSEIRKSAAPRVAEELLDPLRRGWGAETYRLWSKTGLLGVILPELDREIEGGSASPERESFWRMLAEADRRRGAGEILPEASLLGTLFLPMIFGAVRHERAKIDASRLVLVLEKAVNPIAARLSLPNHAVHLLKHALATLGRLAETRPTDAGARRIVTKAWFPASLALLSLYASASGRYEGAVAEWNEVLSRAGKKIHAGEDLSHAAPFPEALVPPPALLSRHEIPLPTSQKKSGGRKRGRRRGGRRPAGAVS